MYRSALACLLLVGCSSESTTSSSSSASSTSTSGGSTGGTTTSSSSGSSTANNCGDATCDGEKEYCELTATKDAKGRVSWTPNRCKAIPSGCTLPEPASACQRDCSAVPPPAECMGPPNFDRCLPDKFCDCVEQKETSCPKTGVVQTSCKQNGSLIGFGCTN